jgi:hypothetical protein
VAKYNYLERRVINQNLIQEEIKSTLNLGNTCYHSVQNLLSSCLLSEKVIIILHKSINLPVVFYACKTCSPTLRDEHRLRMLENSALKRILGPKRDEVIVCSKQNNEELHQI